MILFNLLLIKLIVQFIYFQEYVIIVDILGVGESDNMMIKVLEYFFEVFVFIYVINIFNVGGV